MPGRYGADIQIETQTDTAISYRATFTKGKPGTASLWVSQICKDAAGAVVAAANNPVVGEENGSGVTEPFATAGATVEAYVWVFPDAFQPVSQTLTTAR